MPFWNLPDVKADSGEPIGLPAHAYPSYTDPGTYHTVKPWYSIDNLGEVGSTAVYLPFQNHFNSVCNATLQFKINTMLNLIHNILACDVMQPEIHVNAYEQCKNRKKSLFPQHTSKSFYMHLWSHHIASQNIVNQPLSLHCMFQLLIFSDHRER